MGSNRTLYIWIGGDMITYNIGNHRIKILETDEIIKIYIYGTNEWKDIPVSLKCWRNKYGYHTGADKAADEIAEYLISTVKINFSKTVHIGGISMGGSIAECIGEMMSAEKVITFGQFPVTSKKTPKDINITRYRKGFDLVTYLFPWFQNNKYTHIKGTMNPFRDHNSYPVERFW